jgi:hypothetical protein
LKPESLPNLIHQILKGESKVLKSHLQAFVNPVPHYLAGYDTQQRAKLGRRGAAISEAAFAGKRNQLVNSFACDLTSVCSPNVNQCHGIVALISLPQLIELEVRHIS